MELLRKCRECETLFEPTCHHHLFHDRICKDRFHNRRRRSKIYRPRSYPKYMPEEMFLIEKGVYQGWTIEKISQLLEAYGYSRHPHALFDYMKKRGISLIGHFSIMGKRTYRNPSGAEWAEYLEELLPFLPSDDIREFGEVVRKIPGWPNEEATAS